MPIPSCRDMFILQQNGSHKKGYLAFAIVYSANIWHSDLTNCMPFFTKASSPPKKTKCLEAKYQTSWVLTFVGPKTDFTVKYKKKNKKNILKSHFGGGSNGTGGEGGGGWLEVEEKNAVPLSTPAG